MKRFSSGGSVMVMLALAGVAVAMLWRGAARGQTQSEVTWSGRIRIEKRLTYKKHCTNCEYDVNDFQSEENFVTEYQVERLPQRADAEWHSADVRVQVRGNAHSKGLGVNSRPDASTRKSMVEMQEEGSGHTIAAVTIFLRRAGDEDSGHCRLEYAAIGERDDHGPLTQSIPMNGTEHIVIVYKDNPPVDETKPHTDDLRPEGDAFDIPCGPKTKALRGDVIRDNEHGRYVRVSYDLTQDGEAQTEVVMIPAKSYEMWQPQGGEKESEIGDFFDVRIVAQEKGKPGSSPPVKVKKYKVELVDVSKEPGVCLNWPQSGVAKTEPDLKIDADNPYITLTDKQGQKAETKEEGLEQFMVTVNSHDWGAYGKLQVTAELKDGSTVVGHVQGQASQYALALPKDENSNHIADWWEHWFENKSASPEADEEKRPLGDGDEGDSISAYEEYRGFRVQGKHERLSPEQKDIFIYDKDNLGLGHYAALGLQARRVSRQEVKMEARDGNPWTVNPNHGTHTAGTVYALRLLRYAIGDGAVGETEGGPGVPAKITEVRIDTARIAAAAGPYADAELKSTIAHELGHATNIWHHGDGLDYSIQGDVICRKKDGTRKNFVCAGKECYEAAVQHGMYSGNDACIMRYNSTNFYEDAGGNCEWTRGGKKVLGRVFGYDAPGTTYCESAKGTGVNDTSKKPNKAGDAMGGRGECSYRFCVNSRKH